MANWEYKVISSGKGGFATPALLEKFLNDVGKDGWEIVAFRSAPDNPLAFSGLARRTTQRDWTLEDAAAAAAKAEAEKLRAEFEAKFRGMASAPETAGRPEDAAEEAAGAGGTAEGGTAADEAEDEPRDEWDELVAEDELPTFFEAIRPHMRSNQRAPGSAVGVGYLAKKWGFEEADVIGALKECGFEIPADKGGASGYVEYDGDWYWLNLNQRGELWINTKEKPQPVFRTVAGRPVPEEEGGRPPVEEAAAQRARETAPAEAEANRTENAAAEGLPAGGRLLEKLRPKMRRNRRDAGVSGSMSFLARACRCSERELIEALAGLGLTLPADGQAKPEPVAIGAEVWWLNRDHHGGIWINGRKPKAGDGAQAPAAAEEATVAEPAAPFGVLDQARPLLKRARGGLSGELAALAEQLGLPQEELTSKLLAAGLQVPDKPRQKPVTVAQGGGEFWLSMNAKGQVLLNAKPAADDGETAADESEAEASEASGKHRRVRSRRNATPDAPVDAPEGSAESEAGETGE